MSDATIYYLYIGLSSIGPIAAVVFFILGFRQLFLGLRGRPNRQGQEQGSPSDAHPSGQAGIIYLLISLALGLISISLFLDPFNKGLLSVKVVLSLIALIVAGIALIIALISRSLTTHNQR